METHDTPTDYGTGESGEVRRWLAELSLSDKREENWRKTAKKVYERYRGEGRKPNSFNILWSNTEVLRPAIFNSPPQANVSRRFKDADPVGKVVSKMLERALEFQSDNDEFMHAIGLDVLDVLLPGRGVSRVRYIPQFNPADDTDDTEELAWEQCGLEHVQWDDYRQGPGKTWPEVQWVGFRHRMTREEMIDKFGEDIGSMITLDEPDSDDLKKDEDLASAFRTAECWEIWDKQEKCVYFVAKNQKDKFLKKTRDPLKVTGFFPVPRPMYAIVDSSSLEPIPLFEQYKEQASELDRISTRINKIVDNLRLRGMYDATLSELKNLMDADDNQLVPIQNASMWLDKGLEKAIWMMDIGPAANVLKVLYEQRESTKQVIYELTGISDIRRGSTDAGETLGAQKMKAEYGGQRVNSMTREVHRYTRDLLRIMSDVTSNKFQPETLMKMTNMQLPTQDQVNMQMMQAQIQAQQSGQPFQPPPPPITIDQVMEVLHDETQRNFRIDVEIDSMVSATQLQDMSELKDTLSGIVQFISGVAPAVQDGAFPVEAVKEIVMTICRRSRMGTAVEDALDKIKPPQPPPDPNAQARAQQQHEAQLEQMKGQQLMQLEQMKAQVADQQHQRQVMVDGQAEQQRAQLQAQLQAHEQQVQAQQNEHQNQLESQRAQQQAQLDAQLEAQRMQSEERLSSLDQQLQILLKRMDIAGKIEVAEVAADTTLQAAQINAAKVGAE